MTFRTFAALALILTAPAAARAQTCRTGWCRPATVVYRYSPPPSAAPRVVYAQPQVSQIAIQPAQVQAATAGNSYLVALEIINAERRRLGRGPLQWSANLAAFAASNGGVHAPGSSGGGSQCWAGVFDPVSAARMWIGSAAHHAILINAVAEVGISVCPTGCTANAR